MIRCAGPHLQALIIAAIETGARKGELLPLQWRDLDRDSRGRFQMIRLRRESTKTDKPRTIPISPRLRAVLEMRSIGPDGEPLPVTAHVFGNEVGERIDSVKVAWRATCKRAGITLLTFHDLRREHGSRLLEGGVNLLTVSRLLGHARVSTTDTYLKASEQVTHRELQAFHRKRGKNYPNFTQSPKTNPPGASIPSAAKLAKRAVS